jgi:hypothetical protein
MANPFVGTWKTEWLSYDNNVVGSATLTVTESLLTDPSGQSLDGMWDAPNARPGTLFGTSSGDSWSGEWWYSPTEKGGFTFNFKVKDGVKIFEGTYNAINRTAPKDPYWNGTLIRNHKGVDEA